MRFLNRRLLWLAPLALLPIGLGFCAGPPSYYHEKYAPASPGVRPAAVPAPIVAEVQTEPHTCGFHALSAVYTAYGLDACALKLRFRLGTDKPANRLAPESVGTIPPDMLRVLAQDGFDAELLAPASAGAPKRLREHLDGGHPALALTRPAGFHWVVVAACEGERATICDSLRPGTYGEPLDAYLRERVYALLLIEPSAR